MFFKYAWLFVKFKRKGVFKGLKIRCVSVNSLITDKRLGTIKLSLLSINDKQV